MATTIAGSSSDDFILPTTNGGDYRGGQGNDTYIISALIPANAVITITDTEGANKIQLIDGLTIASSLFTANAVQLTLSNGAVIQLLGATKFDFDIGANASSGDVAVTPNQTYAQFAAELGVPTLPTGNGSLPGTPNYHVPVSGAGTFVMVDLGNTPVTATVAPEAFVYDFQMVGGRATKAGDGEVTITGFDVATDKLVFNDVGSGVVLTEAQFKVLPGVVISENPFALPAPGNTSIYFDPFAAVLGGVTLVGIKDAALATIVVETTA